MVPPTDKLWFKKKASLYPLPANPHLAIKTSCFRIIGKKLEEVYMSECLCFFLCEANLSSTLRTLPCSWEGLGRTEFMHFPLPINHMLTQGSFRTSREEVRSPMVEKVEGTYGGSGRRGERAITVTYYVGQFVFISRDVKVPICRIFCIIIQSPSI